MVIAPAASTEMFSTHVVPFGNLVLAGVAGSLAKNEKNNFIRSEHIIKPSFLNSLSFWKFLV